MKCRVMKHLKERGIAYRDFGCFDRKSCDYPDFGKAAARAVASGVCDRGILVCTTGIGISIAANKVPGVRCALCTDPYLAKMTRLHNDANMLALGVKLPEETWRLKLWMFFWIQSFHGKRNIYAGSAK